MPNLVAWRGGAGAQYRQARLQQLVQAGRRDDRLQRPAPAASLQRG